jgi:hypothetical protein
MKQIGNILLTLFIITGITLGLYSFEYITLNLPGTQTAQETQKQSLKEAEQEEEDPKTKEEISQKIIENNTKTKFLTVPYD